MPFLYRLGEARRILKQPDNTVLLSAMLDVVLETPSPHYYYGPYGGFILYGNSRYIQCTHVHRFISPGPMVIFNRPTFIMHDCCFTWVSGRQYSLYGSTLSV